jgi:quercetin dioxygenase-like cupin family protein
MKAIPTTAAAVLIAATIIALTASQAQQLGTARVDLQRRDLSIPGREAIQVRVDLAPGPVAGRHSQPGEELIYVLQGTFEYEEDGRRMTLTAGDVLFIPAGAVHAARNVGAETASELATYIVEKGRPLATLAP